MNLSSLSSCGHAAPQTASAAASSTPATGAPSRALQQEDGPERHGQARSGGQMRDALVQAFQSLGVALPRGVAEGRRHDEHHGRHHEHDEQDEHEHGDDHRTEGLRQRSPSLASTPVESTAEASAPAQDSPDAAPAVPEAPVTTHTLRSDLHDFMHELFQAARSAYEASTAPTGDVPPSNSTAAASTAPGSRLAIGLGALAAQVGAGQAPPGLQGAFDQLMSDLQAIGDSASSSEESSNSAAPPTLQQVLGALQQQLGYGSSANDSSALGNTIDLAA